MLDKLFYLLTICLVCLNIFTVYQIITLFIPYILQYNDVTVIFTTTLLSIVILILDLLVYAIYKKLLK